MLAKEMKNWSQEPSKKITNADSETKAEQPQSMTDKAPPLEFIHEAVKSELLSDKKEYKRLKELSTGLGWLKGLIDHERDRHIDSKLLTLKLLYAGYFGTKGRIAKYANNPCAIRDAIKFCKENDLQPPEWTLNYIHGLMLGLENLPSEEDEKRWKALMKLLEVASIWEKKLNDGMSNLTINAHFRRNGVSEEILKYAQSFIDTEQKEDQAHSELEKKFNK